MNNAPHYPDSYGACRPFTGRRFSLVVTGHEPEEEYGWRYKLRLTDNAYMDSDGYPIDAVAAGNSWDEAFWRAGSFMDLALRSDRCVF